MYKIAENVTKLEN